MSFSNYERLVRLADEVFAVKSDPSQLDVDREVINRLLLLHPATVSQYDDGNGPVAWVLVIPTTTLLMNMFVSGEISEKELFNMTLPWIQYEALYLCSALVLEEYRRKGITRRLLIEAIEKIRTDHPLQCLFIWPFSKEGELTAEAVSRLVSLPLYKREKGWDIK